MTGMNNTSNNLNSHGVPRDYNDLIEVETRIWDEETVDEVRGAFRNRPYVLFTPILDRRHTELFKPLLDAVVQGLQLYAEMVPYNPHEGFTSEHAYWVDKCAAALVVNCPPFNTSEEEAADSIARQEHFTSTTYQALWELGPEHGLSPIALITCGIEGTTRAQGIDVQIACPHYSSSALREAAIVLFRRPITIPDYENESDSE